MKTAKKPRETKTPGTVAVEKHRPLMNKLTDTEHRRLRQRTAELLYGKTNLAPGWESPDLEAALMEGMRSPHRPSSKSTLDRIRKNARPGQLQP